jgi:hypothetical protein
MQARACPYLKVGVDVLQDNLLRLGLVLAVDHVHVEAPLLWHTPHHTDEGRVNNCRALAIYL